MALYTFTSRDEFNKLNRMPSREQTQVYNSLTGNNTSSNDNFFTKRAKSIDNAIGTTGAAVAAFAKDTAENVGTANLLRGTKTSMNDIAKKYGYNSWDAWQDGFQAAKDAGDTAKVAQMEEQLKEFQGQANTNVNKANEKAAAYQDYMQNNDVSKRINQDNAKFLGSAINTLSTATDVLGLTNGPIGNAIQGGIEGFADELEQNGGTIDTPLFGGKFEAKNWDNFDIGRATQNALTGAASGAVTGLVNKGISNSLAKNGGNLFKGGNKLTQGLNNLGSQTALGRIGSTIATGAGRGAISGAVGGATGAGVQSALQGADLGTGISNALQGAAQGAQSGAATGAIMSGANMAINKTPLVGDTLRKVNQAQQDWRNSGDNFNERWNAARAEDTWGNRLINRGVEDVNAVKQGFKNVGEGLAVLNEKGRIPSPGMSIKDVSGAMPDYEQDTNTRFAGEDLTQGLGEQQPTQPTQNVAWDNVAKESGYESYDDMVQKFSQANPGVEASAQNVLDWADKTSNQPYAVMQQETQNVEAIPSKTSKEAKLRYDQGQELLKQYGAIDQPMARATEAAKTFQKLSDMGFTKPGDVERISNAVTGSNGAVSKLTKSIVETAKPVNTFDGLSDGQTIDEYIDSSITKHVLNGLPEGKAIKSSLTAAFNSLPSRTEGTVTFEDSAADAFKVVQELEALSAELKGKGGSTYHRPDRMDLRQAKVVDDVTSLLRDRINNGADVKAALTPEVTQNLKALEPNNADWAKTVDNFVATAKTPQDLRKFQAPFVRASRYIDNQYIQAATAGGRISSANDLMNTVPTTKAGLVKQVVSTAVNSNPAHRAKAKIYGYLADREAAKTSAQPNTTTGNNPSTAMYDTMTQPISSTRGNGAQTPSATGDTAYNPSTQLYNAIGRTEGEIQGTDARVANYLTQANQDTGVSSNTLESIVPSTGATNDGSTALYNTITGTGTNNTTPTFSSLEEEQKVYFFPPTGDYWSDMLSRAMRRAKDAEDYDAMDSLYEMYQNAVAKQSSAKDYSNPTNWSASDRKELLKAQNGLSQIDSLEQAYTNAVGEGSNGIQGTLRQWANNLSFGNADPTAENYVKQANSIGAGIIKNLVNLGSTEYDAARYIDYLPKLTDTKEQAAQKLQTLRNEYQNVINNLYSVYGA